jgi:hypothetical protein
MKIFYKKEMVGIYKKFKTLTKTLSKFTPYLNNFMPGLGDAAGLGLSAVEKGGDFVNGFYNSYKSSKKNKFRSGLMGGINGLMGEDNDSDDIGQLSTKIELQ